MSDGRKPSLKPSAGNRQELLERRIADIEDRLRSVPARQSTVSGMWDIRGKLLTGSPFTAGGTVTVPAGVYRILAVASGGGGGAPGVGPATGTIFYASATSGGATTYRIDYASSYSGGGHGATCLAWFDVAPFESITLAIGAAGALAYPGGNGGNTTITLPSSGGVITCAGGTGAYPAAPGVAGAVTSTVIAARNPVVIDAMAPGGIGSDLFFKDSGGSVIGGWAAATVPNQTFLIPGTTYGKGGVNAAGTAGVVYLYY